MMHPSLNELRAELRTLQSKKSLSHADALRVADISDAIADTVEHGAERAVKAANDAARRQQLAELAEMPEVGTAAFKRGDLGGALLAAGWRRGGPAVQVDSRFALETKTGSLADGTDAGDAVPARVSSPALGVDARYLYPSIPTTFVAADATGIQSYRQSARTLATPSNMIRDIDAVSPNKPETDTEAEVVAEELKQIASISSGTPNVLLANQGFRQWVNSDLVAAYRAALDYHIITELTAASITEGGGGTNAFEAILYAQEVVRSAGYEPDVVVVSPADALAIRLLIMESGDSYAFAQQVPQMVVTNAVADGAGFTAQASALGTLYLSPFSLQSFEEEAGATNSSTVRGESNGLFVVQRPTAAAYLAVGSE
jgi:hypothetical protein